MEIRQPMILMAATIRVFPRPVKNERKGVSMQISPAHGDRAMKYSAS